MNICEECKKSTGGYCNNCKKSMDILIDDSQEENKEQLTEDTCPTCGRALVIKGNKQKCEFCNLCIDCG